MGIHAEIMFKKHMGYDVFFYHENLQSSPGITGGIMGY